MTPIFRDVRLDRRQLGDLMAPRVADLVTPMQPVRALTTRVGYEVHDRLHALGRHERPMVPRMPRLTAGPTPTLRAATPHPLSAREAIGGRRLRRRRRVLLPQRELPFQVVDLFRLLSILLPETLIFSTESLDFRRDLSTRRLRRPWLTVDSLFPPPLHAPKSTESRRKVQEA
jgi:hypothetical protein